MMSNPLSNEQLQYYKSLLLEDKNNLMEQQFDIKADMNKISSDQNTDAELSMYDNHPADQATQLYEEERDQALAAGQIRQLEQIELALKRISDGTYGSCVICQKQIDSERLNAIPETSYCQIHSATNNTHGHDYEHEPLSFVRLNKDDQDYAGFDGEDMAQTLMEYGNSNISQLSAMLDTEFSEEILDELHGFVEPLESFLATDITGNDFFIVRNAEYQRYMKNHEGDDDLELY